GVVCVMSGSFTQRGQPAICDKWLRAEAAILGGADMVIELPFFYAVSSAQFFAAGAINAAAALRADAVAFGAEAGCGESELRQLADARLAPGFGAAVKKSIAAGASYAAAATSAAAAVDVIKVDTGTDPVSNPGAETRLGPNSILGAEYVAAARRTGYEPEWCVVPREGAGHGEEKPVDRFASATYLRAQLQHEDWAARIAPYVPGSTLKLLKKWRETEQFVTTEAFSTAITAILRGTEAESTEKLPFGSGGVGRMVHKNAQKYSDWSRIVRESTSARYQSSRISRLLVHALVSTNAKERLTAAELERVYGQGAIPYVRVLGVRKGSGQALLGEVSKRLRRGVALITSPGNYLRGDRPVLSTFGMKMLRADVRAQAVYSAALRGTARTAADRDLTQKILIVDDK
ncbi:MAG: nucleotidyltransferase family protein, partial [Clostridia bacterium]|nr:nucleotidyltransferase family protein [Clostridia bacterium]